jgi:hypothetical protein
LSKGAPDSPVRQPRHPTVRVRSLELLTCGPPDSPVVHRTGPVHCLVRHLTPALTLCAVDTVHCSLLQSTIGDAVVTLLGTPDSPVNYSGGQFQKLKGGKFGVILPGAPDTVRWCRPGHPSVVFCSFYLNSFLDFLLVCVEPLALVEPVI